LVALSLDGCASAINATNARHRAIAASEAGRAGDWTTARKEWAKALVNAQLAGRLHNSLPCSTGLQEYIFSIEITVDLEDNQDMSNKAAGNEQLKRSRLTTVVRSLGKAVTVLYVVSIIGFVSGSALLADSFEEDMLRLYFTPEHPPYSEIISVEKIKLLCIEMGDKAIPILKPVIARRDRWRWQDAVDCLLHVDTQEVIDILRREYTENPPLDSKANGFLRSSLCRAMSITVSPADIQFLIGQLDGPRILFGRGVTQEAAFSLAVLKPDQARAALEKRLVKYGPPEYPMENDDIQLALDRINGTIWNTPQDRNDRGPDSVIFSVLRFGIPRTGFSNVFYDERTRRAWKHEGNTWTYKQGKFDAEFPSISFDVYIARDSKHATCKTWVGDGPQSFLGHTFILRKEANRWRVIRLMQGPMT